MIKLELEDYGQDFTYLIVDGDRIVEAGPFQDWLWRGRRIVPPAKWRRGSQVVFADGMTLKYRVTRAKHLPGESGEAVEHLQREA